MGNILMQLVEQQMLRCKLKLFVTRVITSLRSKFSYCKK